jgi:hypothetical protein
MPGMDRLPGTMLRVSRRTVSIEVPMAFLRMLETGLCCASKPCESRDARIRTDMDFERHNREALFQ